MKARYRQTIDHLCTKSVAGVLGITLLLTLAGAQSTASAQTTWYVATNGSDTNGGTGWNDAFATIQKGIDTSSNGGTVLVAGGTYTGGGNKNIELLARNIIVRSVNGPETCIIDLQNDGKGFQMIYGDASKIDGFTIMNGRPESTTDYGVGITCWNCTSIISNCIIKNNSGVQWGAGIDIRWSSGANPLIVNCIFAGNRSTGGGSAVSVYQASATFINCTFYGNTSFLAAIYAYYASSTKFTNCIFWGNTPTSIEGNPAISYSDVQGGYAGTGNIDLPPDFVDPDHGDLRLSLGSDCIDAGLNSATGIANKDLDGKPRFIDGDGNLTATVDMGAYEYGDICECDFPLEDRDTDGSDLAAYINDPSGWDLSLLAADFGRSDCPVFAANR
jgi:hypothetical protein